MNQKAKKGIYIVIFVTIGFLLFYILNQNNEKLPVYNPIDFNPELVEKSLQKVNNNHTVADFNVINQNGRLITQADFEGKIYVADFFFTRCPSICPVMANNMEKLQTIFKDNEEIKLLSLSVTPEMDSVPVLRTYATRNNAIDGKWHITTGEKKHIYNLARKSYFAVVDEGDGGLQDFIHTPNFILIDDKKQIRGVYDGTNAQDITALVKAINLLIDSK